MNVWLCQNPTWNSRQKYIRRLFLQQLSKSLTNAHNERRSQCSRLTLKTKLALKSLGYKLKSNILTIQDQSNDHVKIKQDGIFVRHILDARFGKFVTCVRRMFVNLILPVTPQSFVNYVKNMIQ